MMEQIYIYFNTETIYFWLNIGVLPFWLILFFFPQSKICKILITSIFPITIMSAIYLYLVYEISKSDFNFLNIFNLYFGLDELIYLLSEKNYIILFWIHFLAINLFCGSWIIKDSQKFNMSKFLTFIPLCLTYFLGPLGIFVYWLIRIFFSKKIDLYE
jgi:hypothetical protein